MHFVARSPLRLQLYSSRLWFRWPERVLWLEAQVPSGPRIDERHLTISPHPWKDATRMTFMRISIIKATVDNTSTNIAEFGINAIETDAMGI
jgi:hypothetical protein